MNDRWKIIAGLLVVMILAAFPVWFGWGRTASAPDLKLDTPEIAKLADKRCIESTAFMRTNHMKLLKAWRDEAVREGKRAYTARDGRRFEMSLSGTCLSCHSNKDQFCDRCHDYAGVKPNCFNCHLSPEKSADVHQ